MLAQLDARFIVLRVLERTLVTGPVAADMPRHGRWRPKSRLNMHLGWLPYHKWTVLYNGNLKTSCYGRHHQRIWLQKSVCKMGAKNVHRPTQNSMKMHLWRTPLAQWKRWRCFSVKNHYQWWNLDSSLWPTDKKAINARKKSRCRLMWGKVRLASSGKVMVSC